MNYDLNLITRLRKEAHSCKSVDSRAIDPGVTGPGEHQPVKQGENITHTSVETWKTNKMVE